MVKDVNATVVDAEDRLTDNVYIYDVETGTFSAVDATVPMAV